MCIDACSAAALAAMHSSAIYRPVAMPLPVLAERNPVVPPFCIDALPSTTCGHATGPDSLKKSKPIHLIR